MDGMMQERSGGVKIEDVDQDVGPFSNKRGRMGRGPGPAGMMASCDEELRPQVGLGPMDHQGLGRGGLEAARVKPERPMVQGIDPAEMPPGLGGGSMMDADGRRSGGQQQRKALGGVGMGRGASQNGSMGCVDDGIGGGSGMGRVYGQGGRRPGRGQPYYNAPLPGLKPKPSAQFVGES